jgi:predicted secreted acid phosphatase
MFRSEALLAFAVLLAAAIAAPESALATSCPASPILRRPQGTLPPNIGDLKSQLLNYKCFGTYDREVARAFARAQAYLDRRASRVSKPAIVFDIDETALSNWVAILANDFGYIPEGPCDTLPNGPCAWHTWEKLSRAVVIAPALALYKAAKAKNVAIFFITGRYENARAATEANLRDVGYDGWNELIMRPDGFRTPSAADYKAPQRGKIESQGFKIIVNIGDQLSDLAGGYAERTFKVPNPFYLVP